MLWIFAERFFMAALRQCEKSEGCFAVFTAQPWTAAVLFKLQFSDGLLDNHSAHISKEKQRYLASRPQRFQFVFVPKHGSWLNLVENMFSKMARSMLREIRVHSKQELIQRIHLYFEEVNAAPVVFRWKYKMDEVSIDYIFRELLSSSVAG